VELVLKADGLPSTELTFLIPKQRLVEGARMCRDNACMLTKSVADAFEKHPVVASFLTILALEEIGKGVSLLKAHKKGNDLTENEWTKLTTDRKAHTLKLRVLHESLIDPYSLLEPHEMSVQLGEIKEFMHQTSELAKQVNELKLNYLYVGWKRETEQWTTPIARQSYEADEALARLQAAIMLLSEAIRQSDKDTHFPSEP
jgi:AbiV family abortive infection protein